VAADSIRLIAVDIDGTLLNPQFQISETDLRALRKAMRKDRSHSRDGQASRIRRSHRATARLRSMADLFQWRRHAIAFGRDFPPRPASSTDLSRPLRSDARIPGTDRSNIDKDGRGAIVLEHLQELEGSIRHWLQKNMEYIEFVVPIGKCANHQSGAGNVLRPVALMQQALQTLERSGLPIQCLDGIPRGATCQFVDVLNAELLEGHALERWGKLPGITRDQSWPLVTITTTLKCLLRRTAFYHGECV